jgi:DnaJ-class molecular chaperone
MQCVCTPTQKCAYHAAYDRGVRTCEGACGGSGQVLTRMLGTGVVPVPCPDCGGVGRWTVGATGK